MTQAELAAHLTLDEARIDEILRPFEVERHPVDSPEWREIVAERERRWRRKSLWKRLRGLVAGERRTQEYVERSYDSTWKDREWPRTHVAARDRSEYALRDLMPARWGERGIVYRRLGCLKRLNLAYLERVFELLQPRSVLEVGCGNGVNLMCLAGRFPEIEFSGVELTANGVARAKETQQEAQLPKALEEFCPFATQDPTAFRRIHFEQGDASKLRFEDDRFDLVFTHKALEQMEMIRGEAMREVVRVARHYTVHFEPFADFNDDWLRRTYVATKRYWAMPLSELDEYGVDLIHSDLDMPYNIELASGLVIGRVRPGA